MAEKVIGAIGDARIKTGFLKSEEWVLVVTDQRLLGARMTSELRKQIMEEAQARAKASGSGRLGQWGAKIKAGFAIGERYSAMTPEAVLAETPGNWALSPGQVKEIKVERKSRGGDDEGPEIRYLRITLDTPAGKRSYETNDEDPDQQEVKAMLGRAFGPVVR
jgi:hypothetical protein